MTRTSDPFKQFDKELRDFEKVSRRERKLESQESVTPDPVHDQDADPQATPVPIVPTVPTAPDNTAAAWESDPNQQHP